MLTLKFVCPENLLCWCDGSRRPDQLTHIKRNFGLGCRPFDCLHYCTEASFKQGWRQWTHTSSNTYKVWRRFRECYQPSLSFTSICLQKCWYLHVKNSESFNLLTPQVATLSTSCSDSHHFTQQLVPISASSSLAQQPLVGSGLLKTSNILISWPTPSSSSSRPLIFSYLDQYHLPVLDL
jgi:hypothetical protein